MPIDRSIRQHDRMINSSVHARYLKKLNNYVSPFQFFLENTD